MGYGVSLACFVLALRHLGSARTGAYFSTAPFVGAAASLLVFWEGVSLPLVAASALMALGVWLHLTERAIVRSAAPTSARAAPGTRGQPRPASLLLSGPEVHKLLNLVRFYPSGYRAEFATAPLRRAMRVELDSTGPC